MPQEPEVEAGSLEVPARLQGRAVEVWNELAPMLCDLGLYTSADRLALSQLCKVTAEVEELEDFLAESGGTFETEKGYVCQRPEVGMLNANRAHLLSLMDRFGLSPRQRSGLSAKPKPKESEFDKWRKGKRR